MIIPDDTNTTIVNTSFEENTTQCSTSYTLVNASIEESSNFMEEASNHSTAVVMGDRTVTSPTSQFGNLSFATTQVSQEPVSFAGTISRKNLRGKKSLRFSIFLLCKYDFDFVISLLFPFDDFVVHSVKNYQISPSLI